MTAEVEAKNWFVMRDLKRANAKTPAYVELSEAGFEIFTPMRWVISEVKGRRVRRQIPFMQDLLFAHARKSELDPIVSRTPTHQFRYVKGKAFRDPLTVPANDMNRFIYAVKSTSNPQYYSPDEITAGMIGRRVRIIGGALDSYEGFLLKVRGARRKRLLIGLSSILTMTVEVESEFIEFLN